MFREAHKGGIYLYIYRDIEREGEGWILDSRYGSIITYIAYMNEKGT